MPHAALTISPSTATHGLPTSPLRGYRTLHSAQSIGIKASLSLSLASHPSTDRHGYIPSVDSGLEAWSYPADPRAWRMVTVSPPRVEPRTAGTDSLVVSTTFRQLHPRVKPLLLERR